MIDHHSKRARIYIFLRNFKWKTNPGIVMMVVAIATLIIANSPLKEWYQSFWNIEFLLGTNSFNLFSHHGTPLTLLSFINDCLMAVFFFSIGLEIKREVLIGELSSFRQSILPMIAALGGMIVPVLCFFVTGRIQNLSPDEMRGMFIPMSTDIAFSLAVVSLLGKKVPVSLKVFLLALAIIDDIGGIIVIALFYSDFNAESVIYLLYAAFFVIVLALGGKLRINGKLFYAFFGIIVWYLFLQSGIHPSIAGVVVAFTVPAHPRINIRTFIRQLRRDIDLLESVSPKPTKEEIILSNTQIKYLSHIENAADQVISPLQDFEDNLYVLVNFIILPLFAFANAGVVINLSDFYLSGIALAIIIGLVLGKTLGIFSFTWLTIKSGLSRMPNGMNWHSLFGLSLVGGIGFTVALFLTALSYPVGSEILNQAKLGIIAGSLISGFLGYYYLKFSINRGEKNNYRLKENSQAS